MLRTLSAADLAERLCRPQCVGLFGHRGVGKTTFLTMVYREAVGGRLPNLRLAAADARTADYLSDKILQLESGQPLPATLAESELRFHLYLGDTRLDLLVKDYQGEHIALGRSEPIREFLRDCDAVWLCLDPQVAPQPAECLRRQQEIEQLIEDYLAMEPQRTMDRPIALMVTKADLRGTEAADLDEWTAATFGMTRHALQSHCPRSGLFTVSSLGGTWRASDVTIQQNDADTRADATCPSTTLFQPFNLAEPLTWLASTLQAQDEARMEQLWKLAGRRQVALLERCVACFAQRYPSAPATAVYRQRLRELRRQRRRRRLLTGVTAAACLVLSLWTYDVLGHQQTVRFEEEQAADPAAVLNQWQQYQTWHPTRHLLQTVSAQEETRRLHELAARVRQRERDERLAELRRQAVEPGEDPEAAWQRFRQFHKDFPEVPIDSDLQRLQADLEARRDAQFNRRARHAFDELLSAESRGTDLESLVTHADQFLRDYPGSSTEAEVRSRRSAYFVRLDERDIETARDYSAKHPLNFQTRRELYQRYLDRHPSDGKFTAEANRALQVIMSDWDKNDFRGVRDHFVSKPADIPELVARCRNYLAVHPQGRFAGAATELLSWSERVTVPGEYKVVLRRGMFDSSYARWISRGLKLSVEVEVGGVRYGPSPIVVNRSDPEWDYEFSRPIRWKLGDPVRIRVTDHTWKDRVIVDIASGDADPVAMRLLSGEASAGPNYLVFESDFALPALPKIE